MQDSGNTTEIGPGGWVLVAVAAAVTFAFLRFFLEYDLIPTVLFTIAMVLILLLILFRLAAAISRYDNEEEADRRVRKIVPAAAATEGGARISGLEGAAASSVRAMRVAAEPVAAGQHASSVVRPLADIEHAPLIAPPPVVPAKPVAVAKPAPEPVPAPVPEPMPAPMPEPVLASVPKVKAEPKPAAKPKAAAPKTEPKAASKPAEKPVAKSTAKPTAKPAAKAAAKPAVNPAAKPAEVAKVEAAPKAAPKPKAKAPAAKPKLAKPKVEKAPVGIVRLPGPRNGKADDLQEIEGIGPALEKLTNAMGFYHFDQIAGWSEADVALVDAEMKSFKGRIARDKWVAQAKLIVKEGLEAFRERAKTNNY